MVKWILQWRSCKGHVLHDKIQFSGSSLNYSVMIKQIHKLEIRKRSRPSPISSIPFFPSISLWTVLKPTPISSIPFKTPYPDAYQYWFPHCPPFCASSLQKDNKKKSFILACTLAPGALTGMHGAACITMRRRWPDQVHMFRVVNPGSSHFWSEQVLFLAVENNEAIVGCGMTSGNCYLGTWGSCCDRSQNPTSWNRKTIPFLMLHKGWARSRRTNNSLISFCLASDVTCYITMCSFYS